MFEIYVYLTNECHCIRTNERTWFSNVQLDIVAMRFSCLVFDRIPPTCPTSVSIEVIVIPTNE